MAKIKKSENELERQEAIANAGGKEREKALQGEGKSFEGRSIGTQAGELRKLGTSMAALNDAANEAPFVSALRNQMQRDAMARQLAGAGGGTMQGQLAAMRGTMGAMDQGVGAIDATRQEGLSRMQRSVGLGSRAVEANLSAISQDLEEKGLNDDMVRFYYTKGFEMRDAIRQAALDKARMSTDRYLNSIGQQAQSEASRIAARSQAEQQLAGGLMNAAATGLAAYGASGKAKPTPYMGAGTSGPATQAEMDAGLYRGAGTSGPVNINDTYQGTDYNGAPTSGPITWKEIGQGLDENPEPKKELWR